MKLTADYVIVGSGLTGAVLARRLADQGREVLVLERRPWVGGNVHDHMHASGVRIHTYGPHYFRTSSDRIWEFATRFSDFYKFEATIVSLVEGRFENWPIAASYIRRNVGETWQPEYSGAVENFEQAALSLMPRIVYETFIKEYNEKQWGVPATTLEADLCKRFDVRMDDEPRLTPHAKHQGIPTIGYAAWMQRMLEGVPVVVGCDFLQRRHDVEARRMLVFTGPVDAFFGFDLGRLAYRGQKMEHTYLPDVNLAQPCGQVNNPLHSGGPHIRTLEWKHMMPADLVAGIRGTVLTTEVPGTPEDEAGYEYPLPSKPNAALYERYRHRADALEKTLICGRLGEYRYYGMDQAIGRAFTLASRLLEADG